VVPAKRKWRAFILDITILNGFRPDVCTLVHAELTLSNFCMVKKRKSSNQLEKDRQDNRERMSTFAQKKMEEQDAKESQARQQALKKLGITQEFNYKHHAEIYNYAVHAVDAPIETVDASIAPPDITIEQLEDQFQSESEKHNDPSNLALPVSARPAVRISSVTMRAKRMMLAHCAK
jgi:hypothetical protein